MDKRMLRGHNGEVRERKCSRCHELFSTNAPGFFQLCLKCQEIKDRQKEEEQMAADSESKPITKKVKKKVVKKAVVKSEVLQGEPEVELPESLKEIEEAQSGRPNPLAYKDDSKGEVQTAIKPRPKQVSVPEEDYEEEEPEEDDDDEEDFDDEDFDDDDEEPEEDVNTEKFWKDISVGLNSIMKRYSVLRGYRWARVSHPGADFIDNILPQMKDLKNSIVDMFSTLKNFEEEAFLNALKDYSRANKIINEEIAEYAKEKEFLMSMDAYDKLIDSFVRQLKVYTNFAKSKAKEVIKLYNVTPPK